MNIGVFKRIMDNIVFAMDLNDKIPEYMRQEIVREKPLGRLRNESIEDFNAEVSKKLGEQEQTEEDFFDTIVGYSDIKKLLMRCMRSKEPIHVIFDGAPASAKSMFLMAMNQKLEGAYFVDCTNSTGAGMVESLFNNDVKYLLLDEVEKMSKADQNVLLNVMETGMLTSTKIRKTITKEMNLSIYATTNDIDTISKPFRSRFLELSLPPYTYEDFCSIAVKLLDVRYKQNVEVALKIADIVWNKIKSKDIRDVLSIGKLSKTADDVDFVSRTLRKYNRGDDNWGK